MTWEQMLAALLTLLGRRVGLWVEAADQPENYLPGGLGPVSPLQVGGVLQHGDENNLIESVRETLPEALPADEEVLSFVLGNEHTDVTLTLTRSLFKSAAPLHEDVPSLAITQSDLVICIADQEELIAAARRQADR